MDRPRSRAMSVSSSGSTADLSRQTVGKKAMCRHWVSKGHCDLGHSCKFAHDHQDLALTSTDKTKTQLCSKFAATGSCEYGDICNFAHGESELRNGGGSTQPANYKTKMCKTFLSGGTCSAGAACHYAHGTRELRNIYRPGVGHAHGHGQQHAHGGGGAYAAVNTKTVLCKNWAEDGSCTYGDKCSFAHGEEQIRGSKQMKIISRNPLYKTTMCKKFAEAEFCELGEDCHFAHGQDELRVVRGGTGVAAPGRVGAQYKTSICKQWSEGGACQYGPDCLFAHGPGELRAFTVPETEQVYKTVLCKNWEAAGKCEWGEQCKWAHGREDLQTGPGRAGLQHSGWNSQHKTVLCSKWAEGSCQYGARCMFAHGQAELRSAQQGVVITSPQYKTVLCQQKPCQFGETCSFAHSQGEMRTVQQNLAEINPNYKGTLCKYFMSTGECEFGSICQYAHGNMELRNTGMGGGMMGMSSKQVNHNYSQMVDGITSPQYKTTLCKNYQDSGLCDFGARCQFAHGQLELRTLGQNYLQLNPQYKTTMCSHFTEHGNCPQGHNCQFSHGVQELRQSGGQQPVVKTTMCKVWMDTGSCRNRATCGAAHGRNELGAGGGGDDAGRMRDRAVGGGAGAGYKTQPCRNMKDTGHCSYGSACQFAHSLQEMSAAASGVRHGAAGGGHGGHAASVGGGHGGHGASAGGGHGASAGGGRVGAPGRPVKVVLCQQYSQAGSCERGEACQFAHGLQELHYYRARQVPNYKTTLCQPWVSTGQCSYGSTCMYAHGRGELRDVEVVERNKDDNMQPESKRFRM